MLDSRAVGATNIEPNGQITLYTRGIWLSNLKIHSIIRCLKSFKSTSEAIVYFRKRYPMGELVPFERLSSP
jgi:hypothetical protein